MLRIENKKVLRIMDANINRTKEALRVCEDVTRFILDDQKLTRHYKDVRHLLGSLVGTLTEQNQLISARNIEGDVGKKTIPPELRRKNVKDIFYANSQRAKESVRVLEEFSKLLDKPSSQRFKKIRYQLYALESSVAAKF